ncbi:MAG: dihydrofolate reductase [Bacteroidales bacterium]|nr:dihydrofolate reductase [Bacteroidales bacterium]
MQTNKPISIIVAIAENYAIGRNNDLLWHISADLKRFKVLTSGRTVVMGKNTFYSLPVRPLPNRKNIVLTDLAGEKIDGCVMAYSIEEAIELMDKDSENFIMGGGSIYRQFLPLAQKLYLTRVHRSYEADTFFPEISFEDYDLLEKTSNPPESDDSASFTYEVYQRKKEV